MNLLDKQDIYNELKNEHKEFSQANSLDMHLEKLAYYNNLAKNMAADVLPFDFSTLVLLQRYLIKKGELLTAYHIAKNMILSIEDLKTPQQIPEKYFIWKQIFLGNTKNAFECCEKLNSKLNNQRNIDKVKMFEFAFLGGDFYKTSEYTANIHFKSILKGKKVVLIGPAPDHEIDLVSISRLYDVIVIFNYRQYENISEWKENNKNLKIISYYSQDGFDELSDYMPDYIDDLDGCVIRENFSDKALQIVADKKARYMYPYYEILYYGSLQLMQIAMLDLLQFAPKSISVFGCNLFLSESVYVEGYLKGFDERKRLLEAFAFHNMALQFWIVQMLYINGMIIPSKILRDVLDKNTTESYLENMEKIYKPESNNI